MTTRARWQTLDLSHLQQRLQEVKRLLEQASALTAAQDAGRIRTLAEIQRHKAENHHGNPKRPHYR